MKDEECGNHENHLLAAFSISHDFYFLHKVKDAQYMLLTCSACALYSSPKIDICNWRLMQQKRVKKQCQKAVLRQMQVRGGAWWGW